MKRFIEVPQRIADADYETNLGTSVRAIEAYMQLGTLFSTEGAFAIIPLIEEWGVDKSCAILADIRSLREGLRLLDQALEQTIIALCRAKRLPMPTEEGMKAYTEASKLKQTGAAK